MIARLPVTAHTPRSRPAGVCDATTVCGPVVLTNSCVNPAPVRDGGLKLQVLSAGRPEQDAAVKLMVPVKLDWPPTNRFRPPDAPGLDTVTVGVLGIKAKSVPFTVIVLCAKFTASG